LFFEHELATGAERVVVVGADSPTLPISYVHIAMQSLSDADVVVGPATDGGYYLIGCGHRVPPIFDSISWSGRPCFGTDDGANSAPLVLRMSLLPPWVRCRHARRLACLARPHRKRCGRPRQDPGAPHSEALHDFEV